MSKLNVNPRLPAPGQIDYERAMNRATQALFMQTAQQVNDLSEGKLSAKHAAQPTIPTSGSYATGDYVEKSTKSVTTASDSTYVVMGWIRLTNGSTHVLNTDWVEDRHFLSVIFPADTEPALIDAAWQTPTFSNSWVDFGSGWQTTRFIKDATGFVVIEGLIKSGTIATTAFTLPTGYRPPANMSFGTASNDAFGRIIVNSDGTVVPQIGSNVWFSVNCRFRTS